MRTIGCRYGIGRDRSNEHWISVLRQLIHLGIVSQNITQHSALQLTESARPVLRGEVALMLAEPRVTNLKTRATPKTYGGNYDRPLFAKLRKLRKTLADEANVPPYVMFNDAILLEMAEQLPTYSDQMLRINWVGNRKLERFGLPFLDLLSVNICPTRIRPGVAGQSSTDARGTMLLRFISGAGKVC